MITLTPLYDGLLDEAFSRARAAEAAADRAVAAALLHSGGPTGRCLGCGLPSPCPTTALLAGALTVETARALTRQALLSTAAAQRATLDRAVLTAVATAQAAALERAAPVDSDDAPADPGDAPRALPAMPSAADIFAPNPAFNRALSVLLGGS